jgi:hypothetical protein
VSRNSAENVREFYRKQGEERERTRLIELLNQSVNDYLLDKLLVEAAVIANAIAFIKGEIREVNGEQIERKRIIKLLKEQNVIRNCAATGKLVFVNCNTLEVLYLKEISDE